MNRPRRGAKVEVNLGTSVEGPWVLARVARFNQNGSVAVDLLEDGPGAAVIQRPAAEDLFR